MNIIISANHRRHLHEEFPERETGREFGLEFECLVIDHRVRTRSLHLLSIQDMSDSRDIRNWNSLQLG